MWFFLFLVSLKIAIYKHYEKYGKEFRGNTSLKINGMIDHLFFLLTDVLKKKLHY